MNIDEWGYTRVNGVRVKAERYKRKIKQLERQDGRRGTITGHSWRSVKVHSCTAVLMPPTKRQAYPRFKWVIDCGYRDSHLYATANHANPYRTVTCKKCLASNSYKEAQGRKRKASVSGAPVEKETLRKLFKGWGSADEQKRIEEIERMS